MRNHPFAVFRLEICSKIGRTKNLLLFKLNRNSFTTAKDDFDCISNTKIHDKMD